MRNGQKDEVIIPTRRWAKQTSRKTNQAPTVRVEARHAVQVIGREAAFLRNRRWVTTGSWRPCVPKQRRTGERKEERKRRQAGVWQETDNKNIRGTVKIVDGKNNNNIVVCYGRMYNAD